MSNEFFLLIYADEHMERQHKVVSCEIGRDEEQLVYFNKQLNCRSIEFLQYSNELDLIADEEGLPFSNNPVFQIPSDLYEEDLYIVGNFLVGKRVETIENVRTVGFANEDELWAAMHQAKFHLKLVGKTK